MTKQAKFYTEIGARIRARRISAGLTLEALAKCAGRDFSEISRYERGERPVPLFELARIAGAVGCELADMVKGVRVK